MNTLIKKMVTSPSKIEGQEEYGFVVIEHKAHEEDTNGDFRIKTYTMRRRGTKSALTELQSMYAKNGNTAKGNIVLFEAPLSELPVSLIRKHIYSRYKTERHNETEFQMCCHCYKNGYKRAFSINTNQFIDKDGNLTGLESAYWKLKGDPIMRIYLFDKSETLEVTKCDGDNYTEVQNQIEVIKQYIADNPETAKFQGNDTKGDIPENSDIEDYSAMELSVLKVIAKDKGLTVPSNITKHKLVEQLEALPA